LTNRSRFRASHFSPCWRCRCSTDRRQSNGDDLHRRLAQKNLYETQANPEVEKTLRDFSRRVGTVKRLERSGVPASQVTIAEKEDVRRQYRDRRRSLEKQLGEVRSAEREMRFNSGSSSVTSNPARTANCAAEVTT
jgi:hypothetical protein